LNRDHNLIHDDVDKVYVVDDDDDAVDDDENDAVDKNKHWYY
jgi:hypothetical protein